MLDPYFSLIDSDAITFDEAVFLYALIKAIKPKTCIETGTHRGYSASWIGKALAENGQGILYTVDPFDYKQENIETEHIIYYRKKGIELPVDKIDFLFIDGFHGKQDVLEEIEHFWPKLNKGAIVVFHDCDDNELSNKEMVNAAIFEKGLKTVLIPTKNRMRIYAKN